MITLYTRNGSYPAPLPHAITLPSGLIRTDPASFTEEEIAAAGFTLVVPQPTYNPTTQQLDWNGEAKTWTIVAKPRPSGDEINAERDRRIAAGHTFTLPGYGDIPLQGRLQDQINLQARLLAAQAAKQAGVTDPALVIRDAVNVNHMLTPDQMIALVMAGTAWVEATMQRSWDMKDGVAPFEDGAPYDYATNEAYWTVS